MSVDTMPPARRRQRFHDAAFCAVTTITTQPLTAMLSAARRRRCFHEAEKAPG